MSAVGDVAQAEPRGRRFGRRRIVALATVLGVVVAGSIAFLAWHVHQQHLDAQYGPIETGPAWGIVQTDIGKIGHDPNVVRMTGGLGSEVGVVTTIRNAGTHVVTVTGVENNSFVVAVHWAKTVDGFVGVRTANELLPFPATVRPGAWIYIVTTIRKPPNCAKIAYPGTFIGPDPTLRVHWNSLLGSHRTSVDSPNDTPFSVC